MKSKPPLSSKLPARRGVKPDAVLPAEDAAPARQPIPRVEGFGDPERLAGCTPAAKGEALYVPLAKLAPAPDYPRSEVETDPDALEDLAQSLRSQGLIHPLQVYWDPEARLYRITSGVRRWLAARRAGVKDLDRLLCVVDAHSGLEFPAPRLLRYLAADGQVPLPPLDRARTLHALVERHRRSTRQIADETGLSQTAVVESLALLALPAPVQDLVEAGDLKPSTALELTRLPDPQVQFDLAVRAVEDRLPRAAVRAEVEDRLRPPQTTEPPAARTAAVHPNPPEAEPEAAPPAGPPSAPESPPPDPESPPRSPAPALPEVSLESRVTVRRSAPLGLPMGFEFRPRPGVLVTVYFQPGADLAGRSDPGGVLREAAELADRFDPTADGAVEVKGG